MGTAFQMKVSSRGQVVLPGGLRKQVGLQGGDELSVQALDRGTLAAESAEASAFELATARIRRHLDDLGVTQADLDRALEEVKHEMYEERYARATEKQAVS